MAMDLTYDDGIDRKGQYGLVRKVTATWTSDAGGAASGTTGKISGFLLHGVTIPDGDAVPTNLYDITITDSDSVDVLANCAADLTNRSDTNTENQEFLLTDGTAGVSEHPAVCSELTVTVANAGNAKQGTVILYYRV